MRIPISKIFAELGQQGIDNYPFQAERQSGHYRRLHDFAAAGV
jgi:hypothetical protein